MASKPRKHRARRYRPTCVTHHVPRRLPRPRVEIDRSLAWYVVWCAFRAEQSAEHELRAYGLKTCRLIESVETVKRGRPVEAERTPMGRYLFVGLSAAAPQFSAVHDALENRMAPSGGFTYLWCGHEFCAPARKATVGRPLGRLLSIDDVPVRVPASLLQALADGLTLFGCPTGRSRFAPGEACRAVAGPFAGFWVEIEAATDDRVRALVDLFGRRTSVEFEPDQLEAA